MAVTQLFREFGPVFVKIRRDAKQMPFAFCQYTKQEHAERAIKEGRGRLIKGRPCRCEKAKAHRKFPFPLQHRRLILREEFFVDNVARKPGQFFVERKFGPVVTPAEVIELLDSFGRIEDCYIATQSERSFMGLGEGVMVLFAMYDDGQAAYSVSPPTIPT